ncbi:MAG: homoserine kinase [Frankiales bacterium]|nr:homoserine kinase [Frankiales bacterium]
MVARAGTLVDRLDRRRLILVASASANTNVNIVAKGQRLRRRVVAGDPNPRPVRSSGDLVTPTFRSSPVRVRVPATSANLGPGFDTAGLALTLYDEVVVQVTGGGLHVDVQGEGAQDLPRDEHHLLVRSLRTAFDRLGGQPPGLSVTCHNRIPQARGLGSSSAAICAALVAARALVAGADLDDDAVLELANELEGHPDNVAACLRGGATFAWTEGATRVARIEPSADLAPVAFVPTSRASTKQVRGLLPATVPHADAAANAGRAALLPLALTAAPELLFAATRDLLHQPYRASAMPGSAALVQALRADGVAAIVSGAGPTVLALVGSAGVAAVTGRAPAGWDVLPLRVDLTGAAVVTG